MPRGIPKNAPPQGVKFSLHVSVTDDVAFDARNNAGEWLDPSAALSALEGAYRTAKGIISSALERRHAANMEATHVDEQKVHAE